MEHQSGPGRRPAHEGLRLAARHQGPIHLLITDVVRPGMTGRELVEKLGVIRPETRTL